jgi:hypothetical protein
MLQKPSARSIDAGSVSGMASAETFIRVRELASTPDIRATFWSQRGDNCQ